MSLGLDALLKAEGVEIPNAPFLAATFDAHQHKQTYRQYAKELSTPLRSAWAISQERLKEAQAVQKKYHDKLAVKKFHEFAVGEQCWLAQPFVPKGVKDGYTQRRKMAVKWVGPQRILERLGQSGYVIREQVSPSQIMIDK